MHRTCRIGLHCYEECLFFLGNGQSIKVKNSNEELFMGGLHERKYMYSLLVIFRETYVHSLSYMHGNKLRFRQEYIIHYSIFTHGNWIINTPNAQLRSDKCCP
jgi:hypothetical protein